jgi:hypothetical protein
MYGLMNVSDEARPVLASEEEAAEIVYFNFEVSCRLGCFLVLVAAGIFQLLSNSEVEL